MLFVLLKGSFILGVELTADPETLIVAVNEAQAAATDDEADAEGDEADAEGDAAE